MEEEEEKWERRGGGPRPSQGEVNIFGEEEKKCGEKRRKGKGGVMNVPGKEWIREGFKNPSHGYRP